MASYAGNQSAAIDYQRFAPVSPEARQAAPQLEVLPPEARRRGKNAQARAAVPYIRYGLVAAFVFAVLAVIIFSSMTVSELTVQNDRLRGEISSLKSRENALIAKKEQIYNLAYVEEYAKTQLGMVKMDKSELRYVELSSPERMTAGSAGSDAGSQTVSALAQSLSAVLEYLK